MSGRFKCIICEREKAPGPMSLKRKPSLGVFTGICAALETPPDYILGW